MSDAVRAQLHRICEVLSSVPMFQQRHMDDGLTARWLIDPEDGPPSRQACPKRVYVVLTTTLPDDPQTICAVPLGHSTVPQDCAKILKERTIRPSYYDRGDDTWIPSLGFFCRRLCHQSTSSQRKPTVSLAVTGAVLPECSQVRWDGVGHAADMCACVVVHEATCAH